MNSSGPWDPAFENLVRKYLYGVSKAQQLEQDLNLRANGLDSYNLLGLLSDLEKEYELKIPVELLVFTKFETPATLWAAVKEAMALQQTSQQRSEPTGPEI